TVNSKPGLLLFFFSGRRLNPTRLLPLAPAPCGDMREASHNIKTSGQHPLGNILADGQFSHTGSNLTRRKVNICHFYLFIAFPFFILFLGKAMEGVKEMGKVMYHDWRMVPKHEEEAFAKFTPVEEADPVRHVLYPPLLRAMVLAHRQKAGRPCAEEPMIDLMRPRSFSREDFEDAKDEGSPV
uniref:Uncharacterized protein n=1 Tax=Anolis carolinensis TaxID=28377 RepID=H9G3Q2_ANOCA